MQILYFNLTLQKKKYLHTAVFSQEIFHTGSLAKNKYSNVSAHAHIWSQERD